MVCWSVWWWNELITGGRWRRDKGPRSAAMWLSGTLRGEARARGMCRLSAHERVWIRKATMGSLGHSVISCPPNCSTSNKLLWRRVNPHLPAGLPPSTKSCVCTYMNGRISTAESYYSIKYSLTALTCKNLSVLSKLIFCANSLIERINQTHHLSALLVILNYAEGDPGNE